jgi:hypothetical protein
MVVSVGKDNQAMKYGLVTFNAARRLGTTPTPVIRTAGHTFSLLTREEVRALLQTAAEHYTVLYPVLLCAQGGTTTR